MSRVIPFGFAGYRSFGKLQHVIAAPRINLIAGPNNSGKSNVIHFIKEQYNAAIAAIPPQNGRASEWSLNGHDLHQGSSGRKVFSVGLAIDGPEYQSLLQNGYLKSHLGPRAADVVGRLFRLESMHRDGLLWFTFASQPNAANQLVQTHLDAAARDTSLSDSEWQQLQQGLGGGQPGLGGGQGSGRGAWVNAVLTRLCPRPAPIKAEIVPAIRRVGSKETEPTDYGGSGLLRRLQTIQNPTIAQQELKQQFQQITRFVRRLLRDDLATIDIPHDLSTIVVSHGGRALPLESLGTGVHEVIIIAVAATLLSDQVVCIEEPELHLHPLLQRELIQYLSDNTDNQYFITTHSAHLLDSRLGSIHGISLESGSTAVRTIRDPKSRFALCRELGYQASDLLQANCVLWVEGPSDRIHCASWVAALDRELVEGIHYSVMFYGGRLLAHLSAKDPELTEFISLACLNRNMAVLMDSDRSTSRTRLNATKRRVRDEVREANGLVWVTKGRELENYYPPERLRAAVRKVAPKGRIPRDLGPYSDVFAYSGKSGGRIDKVRLATELASGPVPHEQLDLSQQLRALVRFIRAANGLPADSGAS